MNKAQPQVGFLTTFQFILMRRRSLPNTRKAYWTRLRSVTAFIHSSFLCAPNGGESGAVYAEARRGYFMNGRLLRPALVAVLK